MNLFIVGLQGRERKREDGEDKMMAYLFFSFFLNIDLNII
jgi:hypothetical protein